METSLNLDFLRFKNEVLKDIRQLEIKITEQIKQKNNSFESFVSEITKKIEKIESEGKASSFSIVELMTKINQINDFSLFKRNTENSLYNHQTKIKICQDTINYIKNKYDKIIDENLTLPGIIGNTSKFKNFKDFFNNQIIELQKIKNELEEQKNFSSELKKKLDNLNITMINMIESCQNECNKYTNKKQKDIEAFVEMKLFGFSQQIIEGKKEIEKMENYFEKQLISLNEQKEKYNNSKNDIINIIDEKMKQLKDSYSEKEEKMKVFINDLEEIKKSKNKYSDQVLSNTQSINEIKLKLKRMYSYGNFLNINYTKENKNNINNNNLDDIQQLFENKNKIDLDSIKNDSNSKKIANFLKENNMDIEHKNSKKDLTISQVKTSGEKTLKTNIKNKINIISHSNPKNLKSNSLSIQSNINDEKEKNKNKDLLKRFSINNENNNLSSSLHSSEKDIKNNRDRIPNNIKRLSLKTNKEMKNLIIDSIKNNNNKEVGFNADEDKYSLNKIINSEEYKDDININNKDKKDLEFTPFKPIKFKANNLFKIENSNKNNIFNKSINIKSINFNNNNSNNNNDLKNNSFFKNNIIKNIPNIDNFGDKIKNEMNNENLYNSKTDRDNINKKRKINYSNNNLINIDYENNINNNHTNQKTNNKLNKSHRIRIISDIEKYKNFNLQNNNELNLEVVDSFINNKKNHTLLYNRTSRNENRVFIANNSSEDIKINNIDLFNKSKNNINESNYSQNYSFNGKKIKLKIKDKIEEISPVDNLYRIYFYKKNKNINLLKEKPKNNLKRITPAFGRTAYTVYEKKSNHEYGISPYNNI